jgi:hypothetical protein
MRRLAVLISVCVLAGSMAALAGQSRPPSRGGGQGPTTPPTGRSGGSTEQNQELQAARQALARDIAEGKRLMEQLKADRQAGNREAVNHDNELLKLNREQVKKDQELIRSLTKGRGRGRSRH